MFEPLYLRDKWNVGYQFLTAKRRVDNHHAQALRFWDEHFAVQFLEDFPLAPDFWRQTLQRLPLPPTCTPIAIRNCYAASAAY